MRQIMRSPGTLCIMHYCFVITFSRAVVVPRSLLFNKNSLYFGFSSILLAKISFLVTEIRKLFSNLVAKTLETQNCKKNPALIHYILYRLYRSWKHRTHLIDETDCEIFSPRQTRIDEITNLYNFLYLICLYYYIYTCYIKIYILLKRKIIKF